MSGQSRWLGIPAALLLLTAVLVLGDKPRIESGAARATSNPTAEHPQAEVRVGLGQAASSAATAVAATGDGVAVAMARDASGGRHSQPILVPNKDHALWLNLPESFAGQRIEVTIWRRVGDQREATPWIQMQPLVRADATLPMAGIVPGRYDLAVGLVGEAKLVVTNVAAPGKVHFATATPLR